MKEQPMRSAPGIPVLLVLIAVPRASLVLFVKVVQGTGNPNWPDAVVRFFLGAAASSAAGGFYMVEPNQAAVGSLFGKHSGTVKEQGLRCNHPFFSEKKV